MCVIAWLSDCKAGDIPSPAVSTATIQKAIQLADLRKKPEFRLYRVKEPYVSKLNSFEQPEGAFVLGKGWETDDMQWVREESMRFPPFFGQVAKRGF